MWIAEVRQGSLEQRAWTGVLNSGSVLAGPAILGRRLRPSPSLTFSFVKGSVAGVPVLRGLCTDQSRNSEWGESDLDKDSPGGLLSLFPTHLLGAISPR